MATNNIEDYRFFKKNKSFKNEVFQKIYQKINPQKLGYFFIFLVLLLPPPLTQLFPHQRRQKFLFFCWMFFYLQKIPFFASQLSVS